MTKRLFFAAFVFLLIMQVLQVLFLEVANGSFFPGEASFASLSDVSFLQVSAILGLPVLLCTAWGLWWGSSRYTYQTMTQAITFTYAAFTAIFLLLFIWDVNPETIWILTAFGLWHALGFGFYFAIHVLFWGYLIQVCSFRQAGWSFPLLFLSSLLSALVSFELIVLVGLNWWILSILTLVLGLVGRWLMRCSPTGLKAPNTYPEDALPWRAFTIPLTVLTLGITVVQPLLHPLWKAVIRLQYAENNAMLIYMARFQMGAIAGWLFCGLVLIVLAIMLYRQKLRAWRISAYFVVWGLLLSGTAFLSQVWLAASDEGLAATLGVGFTIFAKSIAQPLIHVLAYVAITGIGLRWRFTTLLVVYLISFRVLPQAIGFLSKSVWDTQVASEVHPFFYALLGPSTLLFALLMLGAVYGTRSTLRFLRAGNTL